MNLTLRGPLATSLYTDALSDEHFTLNDILIRHTGTDVLPLKKVDTDIQTYYRLYNLDIANHLVRELHFSTTRVKLGVSRYCIAHGESLDSGWVENASGWGRFIVYLENHDPTSAGHTEPRAIGEIFLESSWRDSQPTELHLDFIVIRAAPGPEPFCTFLDSEKDRTASLSRKSKNVEGLTGDPTASDMQIDVAVAESHQQETASTSELPGLQPVLQDPRLDELAQDCTVYADRRVDRSMWAAEDWRLSLMCIEWIDLRYNGVAQGKQKQKASTRRVASRLDVMRFGPSIREWLEMRPERIDVVLV